MELPLNTKCHTKCQKLGVRLTEEVPHPELQAFVSVGFFFFFLKIQTRKFLFTVQWLSYLSGLFLSEVLVAKSCPSLWDPMDCSPPGSSVCGILQARILEWVAIPFSRGPSLLRNQTQVSHITGRFFIVWATRSHMTQQSYFWAYTLKVKVKNESEVAQSCPTLCDPMDYSLPGSSIHGIFQARVL